MGSHAARGAFEGLHGFGPATGRAERVGLAHVCPDDRVDVRAVGDRHRARFPGEFDRPLRMGCPRVGCAGFGEEFDEGFVRVALEPPGVLDDRIELPGGFVVPLKGEQGFGTNASNARGVRFVPCAGQSAELDRLG
jgi:hypothetical protein